MKHENFLSFKSTNLCSCSGQYLTNVSVAFLNFRTTVKLGRPFGTNRKLVCLCADSCYSQCIRLRMNRQTVRSGAFRRMTGSLLRAVSRFYPSINVGDCAASRSFNISVLGSRHVDLRIFRCNKAPLTVQTYGFPNFILSC